MGTSQDRRERPTVRTVPGCKCHTIGCSPEKAISHVHISAIYLAAAVGEGLAEGLKSADVEYLQGPPRGQWGAVSGLPSGRPPLWAILFVLTGFRVSVWWGGHWRSSVPMLQQPVLVRVPSPAQVGPCPQAGQGLCMCPLQAQGQGSGWGSSPQAWDRT